MYAGAHIKALLAIYFSKDVDIWVRFFVPMKCYTILAIYFYIRMWFFNMVWLRQESWFDLTCQLVYDLLSFKFNVFVN